MQASLNAFPYRKKWYRDEYICIRGPLWHLNHVWIKRSVHLSGSDATLGISSLSFPVLRLQQCLLGKGWVQLSWPLRARAPKLSMNFVLTAFWIPHCWGLWMTFPGDQCRRTVSDMLFCQHVGIIPGFYCLSFLGALKTLWNHSCWRS